MSENATPIRAVLFDFGKVLSAPPRPDMWQAMHTNLGLEEDQFHTLYWKYRDDYDCGKLNGTAYWHAIANDSSFPLTETELVEMKRLDTELWTDLNQPMVDWAQRLQHAGITTGILSNIGDAMEDGVRGKFSWIADFNHCVWSHALKMRKPENEIYAAAAEGLGIPPAEIVFIDDREDNIEGARSAGMKGILYRDHQDFLKQMETAGLGYLLQV